MEHISQRSIKSEFKELNLVKLTQEVLTKFALRADNQNVSLSLECKAKKLLIQGSETFLNEAIDNLIDNALLYGPTNGGSIQVSLKGNDSYAELIIKDDGKGIKPELLPNIFDRFFHDSETNSYGSGLGLSIAKTIIEFHEGKLTLTSDHEGTSLNIILPISSGVS